MANYNSLLFNSLISGLRKLKSQEPDRKLIIATAVDSTGVEYRFITTEDSRCLPAGFTGVIPNNITPEEEAEINQLLNR